MTMTITGFDRVRGRVWQDRELAETVSGVVCLDRCPAAVISTAAGGGAGQAEGTSSAPDEPDGAPYRFTERGRSSFPLSGSREVRVLTAASPEDAVVEERDPDGRTHLRIVRPAGSERVAVPYSDYGWAMSPDGKAALAFTTQRDPKQGRLLRFTRDVDGWKPDGAGLEWGTVSDVCLAGRGETALVTGARAALVRGMSERRPLEPALAHAAECALGTSAAALVMRSMDMQGGFRTVVHGLGPDGLSTWKRELATEAGVTAHPTRPYIGVSDGRTFTLLDAEGEVARSTDGVATARFVADGELVVVTSDGDVKWMPNEPADLAQ
ncbi:hypothetical protein ABT352_13280 [Streptosporangium sp. NPDC000563]|uniref:hypothetical protein n=1 Tax=Streptosporangium sp. NPDC000563 TaxID=3154366 RepID=UPI0033179B04